MSKSSSTSIQSKLAAHAVAPLVTVLRAKLRQPQFYWFLGHFLTLYHYFRFNISFTQASIRKHYGMVLFYIVVTYGIVLYQFYKSGQLRVGTVRTQIRTLDNLQYFVMTFVLWCCRNAKIISTATYSPVIYALFHSLNYFKESLLPFLPMRPRTKDYLATKIAFFITNYNEKCLILAQNTEFLTLLHVIVLLPLDLVSLLWRFNNGNLMKFVAAFTYLWFFKLRYGQSPQMRAIVHECNVKTDQWIQQRAPYLQLKWQGLKTAIVRFFSVIPI